MSNSVPTTPESRERSSAESIMSYETSASSIALPPLQTRGPPDDVDRLTPLYEDDPQSFDLLEEPNEDGAKAFSMETRSEQMFSREHLQAIFKDTSLLLKFTTFLGTTRPASLPTLIYYLDALKATRAINYANAIAEALEPLDGLDFTNHPARPTVNSVLEEKAKAAFDVLVREDLPCFIAHTWIQTVSVSIRKRITGDLPPALREASEGLAEVFCLSDPSRPDNPIVFASEEFHRTTQYGVNYAIGRNCRFLQGPKTNRSSAARIRKAIEAGKEVNEVFLNYRRDGSPFMNLLMCAPLFDSRGKLRYFIGAQVDVSGLVKDCTDLEALQRIVDKEESSVDSNGLEVVKDEFQELSEMFNVAELDTVRKHGGRMHREQVEDDDTSSITHRPRLLLRDSGGMESTPVRMPSSKSGGRLSGVYKNYLLIRPAPSLRILFTSPSLRVPGILQSSFLSRIGGSPRVRESLAIALSDGSRGVTAKIRWLTTPISNSSEASDEGRSRWIHCTPLLGAGGRVGVWMVVLVDDEGESGRVRKFREAPPVPKEIRRLGGRNDYESNGPNVEGYGDELFGEVASVERDARRRGRIIPTSPTTPTSNGFASHMPFDANMRPGSSMSAQRAASPGYGSGWERRPNTGSAEGSIASFALT
ncbi:uncharacterized protein BDZ99DRAFT_566644 [Mytilinidion resinicola]|uniref:PAC domain-containing protein n=1 Tax=Mytilinidion resinicola TaxID=574789 RepID=A0A6A6Z337_9PEZI|nr:uncharacterized protein BDZ99DRAFT_566644 [Mytilinidion resinicola]KAF2814694.1 hypothetical protein BDZ99DRAFT_566644 [Mytilinidion resinicola]